MDKEKTYVCPGMPNLVEMTQHAERMAEWIDRTAEGFRVSDDGTSSWDSASTWLKLTSGLTALSIDLRTPAGWLCSTAADYESADSESASGYFLELTRLLYAYNAVETMSTLLAPASTGFAMPRTVKLLSSRKAIPIRHDICILVHFCEHAQEHAVFSRSTKLTNALSTIHDDPAGSAIRVGFQVRHLFAHGVLSDPGPERIEHSWSGASSDLCMVKHATACLLFTIQRLMIHAAEAGELTPIEDRHDICDGVWLGGTGDDGAWAYELSPVDYLRVLHLQEGIGPGGMVPPDS